ncbi:MAG: DUF5677 domain-containing protein [Candidatus Marinimicrobia bacterium]|nr:DUF5677 domain-containing protein [Candidatus Neomarinimicrobiota bacterium]
MMRNNFAKILNIGFELNELLDELFKNIKTVKGNSPEEITYNKLLFQYCIIIKKDLLSILILYQNNQNYTPHMILRNMIEHFITLKYIEGDKKNRIPQYIYCGVKKKRGGANWMLDQKYTELDKEHKNNLEDLNKEYESNKKIIEKWVKNIEVRSNKAKVKKMYVPYRYFSLFVQC